MNKSSKFIFLLLFVSFQTIVNAQEQVKIYSWSEEQGIYEDVTSDVNVQYAKSINDSLLDLKEVSQGFLKMPSHSGCYFLRIEDLDGKIYAEKICVGIRKINKVQKIYLGSDYYHYNMGASEPFTIQEDKVRIVFKVVKEDKDKDYVNFSVDSAQALLEAENIRLTYPQRFNVYNIDSAAIDGLSRIAKTHRDQIIISPLYSFGKYGTWVCDYFTNRVDLLLNDVLSEEEQENLKSSLGLIDIEEASLNGTVWDCYQRGVLYKLKFTPEAMINYNFLQKIRRLELKDGNVLAIRTFIAVAEKKD